MELRLVLCIFDSTQLEIVFEHRRFDLFLGLTVVGVAPVFLNWLENAEHWPTNDSRSSVCSFSDLCLIPTSSGDLPSHWIYSK